MCTVNDYSELIRSARSSKNWSQAEVARKAGISQGTVSNYESGAVKRIDHQNLMAIAKVLGISRTVYKNFCRLGIETKKRASPQTTSTHEHRQINKNRTGSFSQSDSLG